MPPSELKKKLYFKYFLVGFFPLAVTVLAGTFYIHSIETDKYRAVLEQRQYDIIDTMTKEILSELSAVISDLMILSDNTNLHGFIATDESRYLKALKEDFYSLSKRKRLYDQVRFLDNSGLERVRVNFNNGQPRIINEENLQNKSKRYYFRDTYRLDRDEVFVSPFDLNIERGKIEQPLKPMIRFGTPVYDKKGHKQGIVLLNYLGKRLIGLLGKRQEQSKPQLFFLNSEGYWLKGERPEQEWAFMYKDRQDQRFDVVHREEWKKISSNQSGQFVSKSGMFTFNTIYPFSDAIKTSTGSPEPFASSSGYFTGKTYHWKIVSFVSDHLLKATSKLKLKNLLLLDLFFLAVLILGIWLLAKWNYRQKIAENEVFRMNKDLEKRVKLRTAEITEANEKLNSEIQERLQTEMELRESEEKFRSMMESMNDLVYICSHDRKIEYMNPSMIKMIGRDVIGQQCHKALFNFNNTCPWCVHDKVMACEFIETNMVNPLNDRTYRVSHSPMQHEDGTISKMTIFRDITDYLTALKEKEKTQKQLMQAQKFESIGTLAGGIAHDFNNILSSILGFTELALDDVETGSPIEGKLQGVYEAGIRAKELVGQILAFARQSEAEVQPIQIDKIVQEVLRFIRSSIPTTIEIKGNINSDFFIMGNQTQVHQIMMNLCTNAAHAMDDEGGVLEVSLKGIEVDSNISEKIDLKRGNYVEISVTDTGTGMPPEIIDSIFEPYFTTKDPGEGTGMGLAMVRGIIESYGGKITVNSILGKGTTFTFYLPVTIRRKIQRQYEPEQLPKGTERILFVDDEAPIATMGSLGLERLGYKVTTRTSSIEALELFKSKSNDFDLVITDMTMPNMTGDILAVELMAIRPDIPVILCTGYNKKISDESVSDTGIKAFAYKPIVKVDLAKTVRKVLDEAKGKS